MELKHEEAGKGFPLILIHGFPHNRSLWADQLFGLCDRCRVIAPDLRGFGQSPPTGPWSMESFADDIAELMERLDIESAVIGGLSMGGYVAFEFLRKYGERVNSLILANTRPGADSDEGKMKRRDMQRVAQTGGAIAVADAQIMGMVGKTTRESHPEIVQRMHAMMESAPVEGIVGALEAMMNRRDSTPMLADISVPVLIVTGEEDALISPKESRAMHEAIPHSTLAIIPKVGHVSNVEDHIEFNSVTRNFLASVGH